MNRFIITIGNDSVRACAGMDRAMSEPQFVFGTEAEADSAKSVYAKKMSDNNARFSEQSWLEKLTILSANGQIPSLACPYVRVVDGSVVDF